MALSAELPMGARPRVASLQHLPREVLVGILQAVKKAAVGEQSTPAEDAAWQEGFLVPLRGFSRGLRDAVDVCLTARSLSVYPKGSRDVCTLRRVDDWLRHSPRRWPHLTSLDLDVDWPADYLQFALMTIAGAPGCPLLSRLKLNVAPSKSNGDKSTGNLDIGVLGSLANLAILSLGGLSRYRSWSDGLDGLTSVEELELVDTGIRQFEAWPSITRLAINGGSWVTDGEKAKDLELLLVPGLRHLSLSNVDIDNLTVPDSIETLQLSHLPKADGIWDFRGFLPNLQCLKVKDIFYDSIGNVLRHANPSTVEVVIVKEVGQQPPNLAHFSNVQSLVWIDNDCVLPPSISTLTTLTELVLEDSEASEIPPLGALTALQKLSIAGMQELLVTPQLTGLTGVTTLKLSNISLVNSSIFEDIVALAALQELILEGFSFLDGYHLDPLTQLHNLHSLTLSGSESLVECPELAKLASLQTLHLENMSSLFDVPNLTSLLTSLSITHCPNLARLPIAPAHNRLRQLTLEHVPKLLVGQVTTLVALQELTLRDFPTLTSLPRLQGLGHLEALTLSKCPRLHVIDVRQLALLKRIEVSECALVKRVDGLMERIKCTVTGCPQLRSSNV